MCTVGCVRDIRKEIATDRKKHLDVSVEHRVQRFNGVVSRLPRRFKIELSAEGIQKSFWRAFPHTPCAVTLDIRVSTHTYGACSGSSYMPANKQKIHDQRNVVDPVALLRDAGAPCAYRLLCSRVHIGGGTHLILT